MPKKRSSYLAAPPRSNKGGKRQPARRGLGRLASRLPVPRVRREMAIVGGLALAVVIGLGGLGGAYLLYRYNHDWGSVGGVNGHDLSREQLRGRMAVLSLLARERVSFIGDATVAATLTGEEATALESGATADTSVAAAQQSLIDDELVRQLAARDGVATPASPDPWAEATTYASADLAHRVRYVRFGLPSTTSTPGAGSTSGAASTPWPAAAGANVAAATTRVEAELRAGTSVETIVADLHDAGWEVLGEDVGVSDQGVPADSTLQLDPVVAAGAITAGVGDIVGPSTDEYGRVNLGLALAPGDTSQLMRTILGAASTNPLDVTALQAWANGRALRRAVQAHLLAGWTKGVDEAHFRELVIGSAPDSTAPAGPWVELSALQVNQLSGVQAGSISGAPAGLDLSGDALAKTLKSMSASDRSSLFRSLTAAANSAAGSSQNGVSGEQGFFAKTQLLPAIGAAAFAGPVRSGDVLGPIDTPAGPQLFLVEARFSGYLDDRAQAALQQVRSDAAPDLAKYTTQFSAADVALAADAGWRSEPEFGPTEPVRSALFDTAIGALSDPFVLDGKLAVAIVSERKTAVPDARNLARLTLDGYDVWFAAEYAKATVTRSDNPLPELAPSASPTASPTAAGTPLAPLMPTPQLPVIPGQPAATPVKTDALGLPLLP
jgi:parvulin-like peptidyl-prolyl isomerase